MCVCVGGTLPKREAGMSPAHHVMPGTDIGSRSADRLTVLWVGPIPGPMSCGQGWGMRRKQGGAEDGWAQEACPVQAVRANFYHVPTPGLLSEAKPQSELC